MFAKDNGVYFKFYPHFCTVKSQATNEVLLQGIAGSDGLYSFPNLKLQEFSASQPSLRVPVSFTATVSKDVVFNENRFPYSELFPQASYSMTSAPQHFSLTPSFPPFTQTPPTASIPNTVSDSIPLHSSSDPASNTVSAPNSVTSPVTSSAFSDPSTHQSVASTNLSQQQLQDVSDPPTQSSVSVPESEHQLLLRPPNVHPMQTRSKSGFHNPRIHPSLFLTHCEPRGVKQEMADPDWLSAMKQEYNALINNHTWDLVSLPTNRKAVGFKWVFRVKENADGTLNMYKARLVAKGFHQVHRFDFHETFSPVVKPYHY